MTDIVIATNNAGKLAEFRTFFKHTTLTFLPQSTFNVDDADETGTTFIENAIIKARHASKISQLPCIADDSGLVIDGLQGAPGIYSARYAGEPSNAANNRQKVLHALKNVADDERRAHFYCCLAYLRSAEDAEPIITTATWQGTIIRDEQGGKGFGYDPIFFVPEYQCTAAQLDADIKNTISHRGQALKKLYLKLKNDLE
jgi:XTP/dITP diphosphohydrolase